MLSLLNPIHYHRFVKIRKAGRFPEMSGQSARFIGTLIVTLHLEKLGGTLSGLLNRCGGML